MANALQQQMADDIASLVRKQTFAGSGVWRQSGNATLRIETQTNSIVEALQRLPSVESQEEEEREDDRQHAEVIGALENLNASDEGGDSKKGGFFKNMLSGIVGFPIKMIKGLFSGLGSIGKLFKKFGKFLLTPFAFIGTLGGALTATAALVSGLSAIGALFAGVAITSFMLTDAEFEELKNKIAGGVAEVFRKIVEGAVNVYNKFSPKGLEVSEADKKKFSEATFVTLRDSIIAIIDFVKGVTDSFGTGFLKATKTIKDKEGNVIQEGLDLKIDNFLGAFDKLGDSLGLYGKAIGNMFKDFKITFDGVEYKGLTGSKSLFELMGYLTGKLVGGVLDFATAIANFVADPGQSLGKFKGTIQSTFEIMGKNISDFFLEVFSIESLIRMLESTGLGMFIPDSVYQKADEQRKDRSLSKISESYTQQAKQQKIIEKNQEKLKTIPVTDVFKRRDVQAKITKAQDMLKFYKEEGDSAQQSFEAPPLQPLETQDFSFGLGNILLRLNDIVLARPFNAAQQMIGDALLPDVPVNQMERPALSQALDEVLSFFGINTGENLNQLQVARTGGGMTGTITPVVIDNSQQPTIINQTNVAAPQTRGPALVGEGRDKVNMR